MYQTKDMPFWALPANIRRRSYRARLRAITERNRAKHRRRHIRALYRRKYRGLA